MKIVDIAKEPLEKLPYITAVSKGAGISYEWLSVYWGEMLELPEELDAIIIASDLQGIAGHRKDEYISHPNFKAIMDAIGIRAPIEDI